MTQFLVEFVFKKVFTSDVVSVVIDPCQTKQQIYDSIMPIISTHYPHLDYGQIELVAAGQEINGQPENAPHMVIDEICFKNTSYWKGYNEIYSFYTRAKLDTDGCNCPICFESISNIQRPYTCCHGFCDNCIRPWIHSHDSCPTCRASPSPHYHLPLQQDIPVEDDNIYNNLISVNYMYGVMNILLNNDNNNNYNNNMDNNIVNNYINIAS